MARHTRLGAFLAVTGTLLGSWCSSATAQEYKYEKYKLKNGMTVILHEDHALPVVTINTWFRVGAREEPKGRSGFAHLFEHLMFMGTERVPDNQFDVIMETGGGSNNASTSLDRTNYFSSGPSSLLPTLLWLDADRLEDLGRTMTSEKLKKQQDVVRNEIRQNVENTPYGRAGEYMNRYIYPASHPYHWNVYGLHEDLEAATVDNVKDFFGQFYVPNNASLVIAGDFKSAEIKPLVEQLFGTLAQGAPVQRTQALPVTLESPVRVTMYDKVQLPGLFMAWHSPAQFAEGDADMDLVGAVLTSGKDSRLYKRLVMDEQLASDVSAYQSSAGLGSLFQITVLATPGADLNRVEAIVDEELQKLVKDGPTAAELDQRKTAVELGKLQGLGSLLAVADKLNEYEYFFGEPNSFKRDLDRYRFATPATVKSWAGKVLDPQKRGIIRVLPEAPERSETPRDKRPADLATGPFKPVAPETFKLANGMEVMLWNKPELPMVAMNIMFIPNLRSPIQNPGQAGLPNLMTDMLSEGTTELDSLAFSSAIQGLGATFGAGAGPETINVSAQTLGRNFGKVAELVADAIRKPRMDQADFDRVKRLTLDDLAQQEEQPTVVAVRVGLRSLFGENNPYGWPMSGTLQTVEKLTLDDVKSAHKDLIDPETAVILVSGDITSSEAKSALDTAFGDWKSTGRGKPAAVIQRMYTAEPPAKPGLRFVLVDRPSAVQTVVRFIAPAPAYRDESRSKLSVMNTILGGSFTSRLNQNLRERNGFTYGAGSRMVHGPNNGYFVASSSVQTQVTGAALKEFLAEFQRLRGGALGATSASAPADISDDEATKAKLSIRTDLIQTFEGLGGVIGAAADLLRNDMPFDSLSKDLQAVEATSSKDLNGGLGRTGIALEEGVLVLVGDKAAILPQLKDLGLPEPVEVDSLGHPKK